MQRFAWSFLLFALSCAPRAPLSEVVLAASAPLDLHARIDRERLALDGDGQWTASLRTVAFGRRGALADVGPASLRTRGARVELLRGDLLEWYIDLPRGIEQGFTLARSPRGSGDVIVEIEVSGLSPIASGGAVSLVDADASARATIFALAVVDRDGAVVPSRFEVEGDRLRYVVDDIDARYPIVIDPIVATPETVLEEAFAPAREFGASVAVDADTAMIGAPNETGGAGVGAVHYYARGSTGTWTTVPGPNEDGFRGTGMGHSVALDGDRSIIGHPSQQTAYIVPRVDGRWDFRLGIDVNPSDRPLLAGFGSAVGISGDTVIVGAPQHSADRSGRAYVYVPPASPPGFWTEQAILRASDSGADAAFGTSVAIDGDVAVVGACAVERAYVFRRSGTTWTEEALLRGPRPGGFAGLFGCAVAIEGETIVVGAFFERDEATMVQRGAVYVFAREAGAWVERGYLRGTDTNSLGATVAIAGDVVVAGDGVLGGARILVRSGGVWSERGSVPGPGGVVGTDGNNVVVGAPTDGTSGRARTYRLSRSLGDPCALDAHCSVGACVDGVCCDSPCGSGAMDDCLACSVALGASVDGTCGPAEGIPCGAARCDGTMMVAESSCDATGACAEGARTPCEHGCAASACLPEPGTDASVNEDAGMDDAGMDDAGMDAGVSDAGRNDAGMNDAATSDAGATTVPAGCGCRATGRQRVPVALFAVLLLLGLRRHRR